MDLMDHNCRYQESVRDMRCILPDLPAGVVEGGVVGEGGDYTRCRPATHVVELPLVSCGQRVPLHRTSLVRET